MAWIMNLLYLGVIGLISPWLVYKAATTGKYRRGFVAKWFGPAPLSPAPSGSVVWFHGVSVGEIHLLKNVVAAFRGRHPDIRVVVSTTTDTGYDEACKNFPDLTVIWWPFDFSWSVSRALDRIRPSLVVLGESELWPNFLRAADARGIPVAVINARMSPRSCGRFERFSFLTRGLFRRVRLFAAQTPEYAERYRRLGAENVVVTGSVKYDGALGDRHHPRVLALAALFRTDPRNAPVIVAGSTQSPEEEVCLAIVRKARERNPGVRLILVPRQKDRFDDVARLLTQSGLPFVRRSELTGPTESPIVLVDTIGELGAIWGLADVAFVGGSLDGRRGGQNMIEPAAYGAAVVFGPCTWNFKETVARLLEHRAAIEALDARELENVVLRLLDNAAERDHLGVAAREFVRSQHGATERTLAALDDLLPRSLTKDRAA